MISHWSQKGFILDCLKLCNKLKGFFIAYEGNPECLAKIVQEAWVNAVQPFTISCLLMGLDAPKHDVEGIDSSSPGVAPGTFFDYQHDHELLERAFKQFIYEGVDFPAQNVFLDLFRDEPVNVIQTIASL